MTPHRNEKQLRTLAIENRFKAHQNFDERLTQWEQQFKESQKFLGFNSAENSADDFDIGDSEVGFLNETQFFSFSFS